MCVCVCVCVGGGGGGEQKRETDFNCCLSVVLQLDKGDDPENSQFVVFCSNK